MINNIEIYRNEPMSLHTTFKIGGNADFFALPKNESELISLISYCGENGIKYYVVGNGSNLLVSDEGYRGMIISLRKFDKIIPLGEEVSVQAGVSLFQLNKFLAENSLTGLEWSYGIPGTVGGGVYMNAGAFGHSLNEFVNEISILDNGKIREIIPYKSTYRQGGINSSEIVLSAKIGLKNGEKQVILDKMAKNLEYRKEKQPYDLPSAGSVFKRSEGVIPSFLIDRMGLKGLRLGGVMVSDKHAGFIVNLGEGKAKDVLKLIDVIKVCAKEQGYNFYQEIIYLE